MEEPVNKFSSGGPGTLGGGGEHTRLREEGRGCQNSEEGTDPPDLLVTRTDPDPDPAPDPAPDPSIINQK